MKKVTSCKNPHITFILDIDRRQKILSPQNSWKSEHFCSDQHLMKLYLGIKIG